MRIFHFLRSYLIFAIVLHEHIFSHSWLVCVITLLSIISIEVFTHVFFSLSFRKYSLEILSLFFRNLIECLRLLHLTREAMCDRSSFWKQTVSPILLLIVSYQISSNTKSLLCCDSETTDFHAQSRRKTKNYFPRKPTNVTGKDNLQCKHFGIF